MTRSKLVVFTLSAAMAGLGGALYGGAQGLVTPNYFAFLLSLTLLLIAVIFGIRTTAGAFVGGIVLALGPYFDKEVAKPRDVFELAVGVAAIGIALNPEGVFGGITPLQLWRNRRHAGAVLPDDAAQIVADAATMQVGL
jgi:branched-chain amino acid transport system permease protein